MLENSVLDEYFHAGQITCVKRLTTWKDTRTSRAVTLLVTCGEDTKVYISLYQHHQDMETNHFDSVRCCFGSLTLFCRLISYSSMVAVFYASLKKWHFKIASILYAFQIKKLCLIDDHISNVRAITTLMGDDNDDDFKVFLFTGGGRASLKCYLLNVDKIRIVSLV